MTVRNESQWIFEQHVASDEDDDDDHFIISLEDNGEEEGLLCNPEEIDYGHNSSQVSLGDKDKDQQFMDTSEHFPSHQQSSYLAVHSPVSCQQQTQIFTFPSNSVLKSAQNVEVLKSYINQLSDASPSVPCSTDTSVTNSSDCMMESISVHPPHQISVDNTVSYSRNDNNKLDKNDCWPPKLPEFILPQSKNIELRNNTNSSIQNGFHSTNFVSKHSSALTSFFNKTSTKEESSKLRVENSLAYSSASPSTVFTVPKLSGPFPKCDSSLKSSIENMSYNSSLITLNDTPVTIQNDECSCIMCYKGRGIKDPDSLVDLYAQEKSILKRKSSDELKSSNKKLKTAANKKFTNFSNVHSNNETSISKQHGLSIKNITIKTLINAPITTSASLATINPSVFSSPQPTSHKYISTTFQNKSRAECTNVSSSPQKAKSIGLITLITSTTVTTSASTSTLTKVSNALLSPVVSSAVNSSLTSTNVLPMTLVYVNKDITSTQSTASLLTPNTFVVSQHSSSVAKLPFSTHKKSIETLHKDVNSISNSNFGNKMEIIDLCSPTKMIKVHGNAKVSPQGMKSPNSKPTILTSPPENNIYTKSLIQAALLAHSSRGATVATKPIQGNCDLDDRTALIDLISTRLQSRTVDNNTVKLISKDSHICNGLDAIKNIENVQKSMSDIANKSQTAEALQEAKINHEETTTFIPQPPEERISKSFIQDWVNQAKTLTSANLRHGEYLEDLSSSDQPGNYSHSENCLSDKTKIEPASIGPKKAWHLPESCKSKTVKVNLSPEKILEENEIQQHQETNFLSSVLGVTSPYHVSAHPLQPHTLQCDSYSSPAATYKLLKYQKSLDSSSSSSSLESILSENCENHLQLSNKQQTSHNDEKLTNATPLVLSSKHGIKLKIKLNNSGNEKSMNKRELDPLMNKFDSSATHLTATTSEVYPVHEQFPSTVKNIHDKKSIGVEEKVETAEEMFQRFQEQAMQEVLKAKLGVGEVSRSLRPIRSNVSFLDRLPNTINSQPKKKKDVEKKQSSDGKINENGSIKSDSAYYSIDRANEKKRRNLSTDQQEPVKQPKLSLAEFPRLKQDTSFTNKKKVYCANILAGHQVYVRFNIYENTQSGRHFLVPFFNIGGTRTQFDVEDMEYISNAVVDFEKEERSCARHLLYYARESKKAIFLRKETNYQSGIISEKNYKKYSFVLEGFQRTNVKKKPEPVINNWKLDNTVSIEIDRAEVDDDAEKHFAEIFASQGLSTSETTNQLDEDASKAGDDIVGNSNQLEQDVSNGGNNIVDDTCLHSDDLNIPLIIGQKCDKLAQKEGLNCLVDVPELTTCIKQEPDETSSINQDAEISVQQVYSVALIKEEPPDSGYEIQMNQSPELTDVLKQPFPVSLGGIKEEIVETAIDDSSNQVSESTNIEKLINLSCTQHTENNVVNNHTVESAAFSCSDDEQQLAENNAAETYSTASANIADVCADHASQSSDRTSSGEVDESDDECEIVMDSPQLTSSQDTDNLHPVQNKIFSLVQSLKQRLANDSSGLPMWLSNEPSHKVSKKRKNKLKNKETMSPPAVSNQSMENAQNVDTTLISPSNIPQILPGVEISQNVNTPNDLEISSVQLIATDKYPVNSLIVHDENKKKKIITVKPASDECEENNHAVESSVQDAENNYTETSCGNNQLSLNYNVDQDATNQRSILDDCEEEIEVGTEELHLGNYSLKPIISKTDNAYDKTTWREFSKPYSILLSKDISMTQSSSPSIYSGTINKHTKHHVDHKKKLKTSKKLSKANSVCTSETNESVTSYLSKKFSASGSSVRRPRLLCNTASKPSAMAVSPAKIATAVPEPISTAELTKTPSLSEIFGIAVKKESLQKTCTPLKLNSSERKNPSQTARKRTSCKRSTSLSKQNKKLEEANCEQNNITTMEIKKPLLMPVMKECFVRLKRLNMQHLLGTVTVNKECIYVESTSDLSKKCNIDSNNKISTFSSRRNKKKSKGARRKFPPKKDIVDYYAYMLESLQKKAKKLEEETLREKLKKEEESEEKAIAEVEKNIVLVKPKDKETIVDSTDTPSELGNLLVNENHVTESSNNINQIAVDGNEQDSTNNVNLIEKGELDSVINIILIEDGEQDSAEKSWDGSENIEKENKTLSINDSQNESDISESLSIRNEQRSIDIGYFEKKDIVLGSKLHDDLIHFCDSEKQRMVAEEDLLLTPNIDFDDDDDINNMVQVDVDKLLGLETVLTNGLILDSPVQQAKQESFSNNGILSDVGAGAAETTNAHSNSGTEDYCLGQINLSTAGQSLPLWKNIPEPETENKIEKIPSSLQPGKHLTAQYISNLKFKLKCPAASIIKSIKLSKEIKNAFGEGNSPTEENSEAAKVLKYSTSEEKSNVVINHNKIPIPNVSSSENVDVMSQTNTTQLPIPQLKLRKETFEAIERAKVQFAVARKERINSQSRLESSLKSDKLSKQIEEDTRFYLRQSSDRQSSIKECKVDTKKTSISLQEAYIMDKKWAENVSDDCNLDGNKKCSSENNGIFNAVQQIVVSDTLTSKFSKESANPNINNTTNKTAVKCNINIDIMKLKLKLNPLLTELKEKNQNENIKEKSKAFTNDQNSITLSSKSLPSLNTDKLCNVLKNFCKLAKNIKHKTGRIKSPVKKTLRNNSTAATSPGRTLRSRAKQSTFTVGANSPASSETKALKSDKLNTSLDKDDVKERSFFDCLQNVNDVDAALDQDKTNFANIDNDHLVTFLHPFSRSTSNH